MKDRKLLMIPGPIEFEPEVLAAIGEPTTSHVDSEFIEIFGRAIELIRKVWMAPNGQPFILAGSGTLAMDAAGANLIEPGDRALVLSTGLFGERFAELLSRYGADVTLLPFPLGETVDYGRVKEALASGDYKLMTATHVDTSTGVRVDPKPLGRLGREYGVLTVLDGVCSVAGEELRQEEWGIDVVLTASQKAIGVPPGLALLVASERAIAAFEGRKQPVGSYYVDWRSWLPIMRGYEARHPAYFATPPVNLICGLGVSLNRIIAEGLDRRIARHRRLARAFRAGISALGLSQVPTDSAHAANTLTAPRYPDGVSGVEFLGHVRDAGVILAGGLHPEIASEYFRIGHMGAVTEGEILTTIGAVETGLRRSGHRFVPGAGVKAVQEALSDPD